MLLMDNFIFFYMVYWIDIDDDEIIHDDNENNNTRMPKHFIFIYGLLG